MVSLVSGYVPPSFGNEAPSEKVYCMIDFHVSFAEISVNFAFDVSLHLIQWNFDVF